LAADLLALGVRCLGQAGQSREGYQAARRRVSVCRRGQAPISRAVSDTAAYLAGHPLKHPPSTHAKTQKPPPKQKRWRVYHLGRKGEFIGTVMAANSGEAMDAAMEKFAIPEKDRLRTLVREAE
jgi:hypothetical protein